MKSLSELLEKTKADMILHRQAHEGEFEAKEECPECCRILGQIEGLQWAELLIKGKACFKDGHLRLDI